MEQETTDFRPNTLDDVLTKDASGDHPPQEAAQTVRQVHGAEPGGEEPGALTGEAHAGQSDAPPASETPEGSNGPETTVPLKALQDERRKRQELAERLASMEQQAAGEARPDPFEDPAGAAEFDRREKRGNSVPPAVRHVAGDDAPVPFGL